MKFLDDYFEMIRNRASHTININFLDIFTIIMDIYTLARMFRTFNIGNKNMPVSPKNIIIYVGDYHADIYNDFFMNYLALYTPITLTIDIKYNTTSCLHLSPEDKRKSVLFN